VVSSTWRFLRVQFSHTRWEAVSHGMPMTVLLPILVGVFRFGLEPFLRSSYYGCGAVWLSLRPLTPKPVNRLRIKRKKRDVPPPNRYHSLPHRKSSRPKIFFSLLHS